VYDDTAYGQEPHYHRECLSELLRIYSLDAIYLNGLKKFEADIQVEYRRDTNWAEEAYENRLPLLFNLMDELVQCEYNRQAPQIPVSLMMNDVGVNS